MTVHRTAELLSQGESWNDVARRARTGQLSPVRHGAWAANDSDDAHLRLIRGTWPLLGDQAVLSHGSAATLHGLPLWPDLIDRVHITRPAGGHGSRERYLHTHLTPLTSEEVILAGQGWRATSLERTAIDLARSSTGMQPVAIVDAALRLGASRSLLADQVEAATRRWGARRAKAALERADGASESVGETFSRLTLDLAKLPRPTLQVELFNHHGELIGRVDFCWEELGVVGEFDGRVKYQGSSDAVADTVMREKRREEAIRAAGWVIVRWDWADLARPDDLAWRIRAAFTHAKGLRARP